MPEFKKLIAALKRHYGAPTAAPAQGPFELVVWENACYLLPGERRAAVFEGLRKQIGLNPRAILSAAPDTLLKLAKMGGMRPKVRIFRWQEIARITLSQFDGDLGQVLKLPYAQAKKALKQFPSIGDPGAEKILMFCGAADGLPLESNGLRVLTRVGYGRAQKNYGAMYRSVQEALKGELPRRAEAIAQGHMLLRQHGKEICRDKSPQCYACPVKELCEYRMKQLKMFQPYLVGQSLRRVFQKTAESFGVVQQVHYPLDLRVKSGVDLLLSLWHPQNIFQRLLPGFANALYRRCLIHRP